MEKNDKIISDYFAQLPNEPIDEGFAARLVELGERTLVERRAELEAARVDRGGIWIAVAATVVLIFVAGAILKLTGVDFAQMLSSMKIETPQISRESLTALGSWSIVGVMGLAMLIGYTLLVRRLNSR